MSNITLYEIAAAYRADAEALSNLDLDEQTLADTLESLSGDLEAKAKNVVFFASNLLVTAAAIKEAEKGMAARRKAIEARAERLNKYVLDAMVLAGVKSIECPHFKLAVQNNPEAVDVFEPSLVPAEFLRQPEPPLPALDKTAIKAAIKAGNEVPGARLTVSQRLAIR